MSLKIERNQKQRQIKVRKEEHNQYYYYLKTVPTQHQSLNFCVREPTFHQIPQFLTITQQSLHKHYHQLCRSVVIPDSFALP